MATLQSGKCFTVPTFFGMCCRSEWQERMYIYKWRSWPDKTWNILCSYCLQWNTSQSKFRNHYFLFLFAFSILSQLFLIWGCMKTVTFLSQKYLHPEMSWMLRDNIACDSMLHKTNYCKSLCHAYSWSPHIPLSVFNMDSTVCNRNSYYHLMTH